jgi:hypothetical protein
MSEVPMQDWIFEADIHRLQKEARETTYEDERRRLERMAEQKALILAARRRDRLGSV